MMMLLQLRPLQPLLAAAKEPYVWVMNYKIKPSSFVLIMLFIFLTPPSLTPSQM